MAEPPRLRVALLFGGQSTEHSISCVSAGSVRAALDPARYEVLAVGIRRDGQWMLATDDQPYAIVDGRLPEVLAGTPVALVPGGCLVLPPGEPHVLRPVDVVLPLLHGPYGEDGTVQGALEMAGLPYVGSGVFASAAAMDKAHMKAMLQASRLPVGPYAVLPPGVDTLSPDQRDRLGLPVFVKPARGGSSIGISKVRHWDDLAPAVALARESDPKVVVEAEVKGREVECGVLDRIGGGRPEASVPAEITIAEGYDFYDFEAKYLSDATTLHVPADLPGERTAQVQALAVEAFAALDCAGLARVDFFVCPDGSVLVNEVNTMPGFTPSSMFPRMWAASGVDYPALVDRLLTLAVERGTGLR